ncbi:unnamed protein product, partial [Onchocerca ochengi]
MTFRLNVHYDLLETGCIIMSTNAIAVLRGDTVSGIIRFKQ